MKTIKAQNGEILEVKEGIILNKNNEPVFEKTRFSLLSLKTFFQIIPSLFLYSTTICLLFAIGGSFFTLFLIASIIISYLQYKIKK